MANSLKEKLEKLLDDNYILLPTYCVLTDKLRTHDAEIRNNTIEEFAELVKVKIDASYYEIFLIDELVEHMKGDKHGGT